MMRPTSSAMLTVLAFAAGCADPEEAVPVEVERDQYAVMSQNALTSNALTSNALTSNALTSNALTSNALTSNALTSNALTSNGVIIATSDPAHPKNVLRGSEAARLFLKYAYECAMPAGASLALDIDGMSFGTITGSLGLAPQWATGACDESCQRWVSACVLARVNPHGVPVTISLRGRHPALGDLDIPPAEANYGALDGAFYGNLFGTTPEAHSCNANYPSGWAATRSCSQGGAGCPSFLVAEGNCSPYLCAHSNGWAGPWGYPNPLPYDFCLTLDGRQFNEVVTVYFDPEWVPYMGPGCDGFDNDGDGAVDEGFGVGQACDGDDADFCKDGVVTCNIGMSVCTDDAVSHGEACNGQDDDCDGVIDNGLPTATFYVDADGDGWGNGNAPIQACAQPAGYVAAAGDCDDQNGARRPGAPELCNTIDDDCNPATADGAGAAGIGGACDGADADACAEGTLACSGGAIVCTDATASTVEVCGNGIDDDCSAGDAACPATGGALYQPLASGTFYGNLAWNYNMGYAFHTDQAITVTSLGGRFIGTKTVRLYDRATGAVLAAATVTGAGGWSYAAISPVTLPAGGDYSVAVMLGGSGGAYYYGAALPKNSTAAGVSNIRTCYRSASTAEPCSSSGALAGSYMYGVADLQYSPATTTSSCAHPETVTGSALTSSCSPCAATVCAADSYCCTYGWDGICVNEAQSWCGL